MTNDVLVIILSIASTLLTALITLVGFLYKNRKTQQSLKHEAENKSKSLEHEYYVNAEKLKSIGHVLSCVKETIPAEALEILLKIYGDVV
jgi:hypothetical protein